MVVGGIVASVLAIAVYFGSKFIVDSYRERVSTAVLVSGASCITTAGFIVGPEFGYFALGFLLIVLSLLLGYEAGE